MYKQQAFFLLRSIFLQYAYENFAQVYVSLQALKYKDCASGLLKGSKSTTRAGSDWDAGSFWYRLQKLRKIPKTKNDFPFFLNFEKVYEKQAFFFSALYLSTLCVWELFPDLRFIASTQVQRLRKRFAKRIKIDNGSWTGWRRWIILISFKKAWKIEKNIWWDRPPPKKRSFFGGGLEL